MRFRSGSSSNAVFNDCLLSLCQGCLSNPHSSLEDCQIGVQSAGGVQHVLRFRVVELPRKCAVNGHRWCHTTYRKEWCCEPLHTPGPARTQLDGGLVVEVRLFACTWSAWSVARVFPQCLFQCVALNRHQLWFHVGIYWCRVAQILLRLRGTWETPAGRAPVVQEVQSGKSRAPGKVVEVDLLLGPRWFRSSSTVWLHPPAAWTM